MVRGTCQRWVRFPYAPPYYDEGKSMRRRKIKLYTKRWQVLLAMFLRKHGID